ncbi:MAG TPA: DNA polymerase III subunit gamma/tau [Acidobacteriota bacterium]|nr:DNA polymerase III subunit gamma/tau [Acidobacteriota bacterium]
MTYQPLALKYRPQKFTEVVGQEVATTTLRNAIDADRIAHAYLFSGMRGVGKTTAARILAKSLNCHSSEGPTVEPCDTCESCREIMASRSIDVLEIDGASNTSVDDVRDLQENLIYSPARDRYKVYIVDEVHMLSKSAFNAFLKTLEEPPKHVVFIFATTEIHKIPPTVLSRCQLFDFGRVRADAIADRLRAICSAEKVEAEDAAIELIVFASEGSIRDAISALDQTINFAGGAITYEAALKALGMIGREELRRLVDAVIEQNAEEAFAAVRDVADTGVDMRLFCRQLIRHVRDLMIARVAGDSEQLLPYSERERELLREQVQRLSEEDIIRFFDILVRADSEMQLSASPQYHLEAAAVKMIHSSRLTPLSEVISRLQSGELQAARAVMAPSPIEQQLEFESPSPQRAVPGAPKGATPRDRLLAAARGTSLHRILDMARSVELDGKVLHIAAGSAVNASLLSGGEFNSTLKKVARETFGDDIVLDVTATGGATPSPPSAAEPEQAPDLVPDGSPVAADEEEAPPPAPPEETVAEAPEGASTETERKVKQDPLAGRLFRELDGTIVHDYGTEKDEEEQQG